MTIIYRRKQLEWKLKISRSTIYAMIKAGTFPRPILIGKRAVGWPEDVVAEWIEDRRSGASLLPGYQPPKPRPNQR